MLDKVRQGLTLLPYFMYLYALYTDKVIIRIKTHKVKQAFLVNSVKGCKTFKLFNLQFPSEVECQLGFAAIVILFLPFDVFDFNWNVFRCIGQMSTGGSHQLH
jgi:hypothetical protein